MNLPYEPTGQPVHPRVDVEVSLSTEDDSVAINTVEYRQGFWDGARAQVTVQGIWANPGCQPRTGPPACQEQPGYYQPVHTTAPIAGPSSTFWPVGPSVICTPYTHVLPVIPGAATYCPQQLPDIVRATGVPPVSVVPPMAQPRSQAETQRIPPISLSASNQPPSSQSALSLPISTPNLTNHSILRERLLQIPIWQRQSATSTASHQEMDQPVVRTQNTDNPRHTQETPSTNIPSTEKINEEIQRPGCSTTPGPGTVHEPITAAKSAKKVTFKSTWPFEGVESSGELPRPRNNEESENLLQSLEPESKDDPDYLHVTILFWGNDERTQWECKHCYRDKGQKWTDYFYHTITLAATAEYLQCPNGCPESPYNVDTIDDCEECNIVLLCHRHEINEGKVFNACPRKHH